MQPNPLDMLRIIQQHGNLTIPEFIARVGISPTELVDVLQQLQAVGLIEVKDPEALVELREFAMEIDRTFESASPVEKRQVLFGFAARPGSVSRNSKLRPTINADLVA